ncbi:ABC transporter substrate-binding protein [Desulfopila sp. IMCC35008]|uniref:ABC transporter substrate-binding protein n=1 Tax=Desulfopila sp. IMCC35008 TaxID=2653858 RepID=UPI0013D2BC39|nr:ABC transporter substrate-binding protein [Desulfopila sp. IMCC35008]
MRCFAKLLLPVTLLYLISLTNPVFGSKIKIGFDIPLTGEFEVVGKNARQTGDLILKQVNDAGGLHVNGQVHEIEFIYNDNQSTSTEASGQVLDLVSRKKVLAIVGPLSSRQAVPAGGIANSFSTPLISPWSTSPDTTKKRPFVFRSGYLLEVQAPVLTKFITNEFKATKAAVLYDIVSTYPRIMAKSFRDIFEETNGKGSVVVYEEFRTGETDLSKQLQKIVDSDADILFTPQHYNEVPGIVRQARKLGWEKPIIGSNSWAGGNLTKECGSACDDLFFVGNYAAGKATGKSKDFVEVYKKAYGELPDEVAALTWDAVQVLLLSIENSGGLTGNLIKDRATIRERLTQITNYEGVTGKMSFNESGDPAKCAVIIKIENGINTHYSTVCP